MNYIVASTALLILGVVIFSRGVIPLYQEREWKRRAKKVELESIQGEVLKKRVVSSFSWDVFSPAVLYNYKLDETSTASRQIYISGSDEYEEFDKAQMHLKKFTSSTIAFVDPDDRSRSVLVLSLSRKKRKDSIGLAVSGAMVFGLGICIFFARFFLS